MRPLPELTPENEWFWTSGADGKLRFLRWAMYGNNQPQHPVHKLSAQEVERVWEAIKSKPARPFAMAA